MADRIKAGLFLVDANGDVCLLKRCRPYKWHIVKTRVDDEDFYEDRIFTYLHGDKVSKHFTNVPFLEKFQIPRGESEPYDNRPLDTAIREFTEETLFPLDNLFICSYYFDLFWFDDRKKWNYKIYFGLFAGALTSNFMTTPSLIPDNNTTLPVCNNPIKERKKIFISSAVSHKRDDYDVKYSSASTPSQKVEKNISTVSSLNCDRFCDSADINTESIRSQNTTVYLSNSAAAVSPSEEIKCQHGGDNISNKNLININTGCEKKMTPLNGGSTIDFSIRPDCEMSLEHNIVEKKSCDYTYKISNCNNDDVKKFHIVSHNLRLPQNVYEIEKNCCTMAKNNDAVTLFPLSEKTTNKITDITKAIKNINFIATNGNRITKSEHFDKQNSPVSSSSSIADISHLDFENDYIVFDQTDGPKVVQSRMDSITNSTTSRTFARAKIPVATAANPSTYINNTTPQNIIDTAEQCPYAGNFQLLITTNGDSNKIDSPQNHNNNVSETFLLHKECKVNRTKPFNSGFLFSANNNKYGFKNKKIEMPSSENNNEILNGCKNRFSYNNPINISTHHNKLPKSKLTKYLQQHSDFLYYHSNRTNINKLCDFQHDQKSTTYDKIENFTKFCILKQADHTLLSKRLEMENRFRVVGKMKYYNYVKYMRVYQVPIYELSAVENKNESNNYPDMLNFIEYLYDAIDFNIVARGKFFDILQHINDKSKNNSFSKSMNPTWFYVEIHGRV